MKHKPSRFLRIDNIVSGIAGLSGFGYMLFIAIDKVMSGRGQETYITFWLVEFDWVDFLVCTGAVIGVLIAAMLLELRHYLEVRALKKKYGTKDDHA